MDASDTGAPCKVSTEGRDNMVLKKVLFAAENECALAGDD